MTPPAIIACAMLALFALAAAIARAGLSDDTDAAGADEGAWTNWVQDLLDEEV